jgi:hypothetical protein
MKQPVKYWPKVPYSFTYIGWVMASGRTLRASRAQNLSKGAFTKEIDNCAKARINPLPSLSVTLSQDSMLQCVVHVQLE